MTTTATTPQTATTVVLPRATGRSDTGVAPVRNNHYRLLQVVLFWAGAILLPLGLVVIALGWYGAANTPYQYDQIAYLVSGGLFGLGLTFCGGFLYFGAWLARIADDGREASQRLSDTLLVLADVTARSAAISANDAADVLVTAGDGDTMHRRDCGLITHRDDLHPAGEHAANLAPCRVCRPLANNQNMF